MNGRRLRGAAVRRGFVWLIAVHAATGSTLLSSTERLAEARTARRVDKDAVLAAERLEKGKQALAASDYATAYSEIVAAYRLAPSALALLALGQLAQREGRLLQAQDLLRRYLAESGVEAAADVAAVLAQPSPPFAEVKVLGPRGALVSVDERLVGSLPLTRPLLLGAGKHPIALELPPRRRALVGQRIEGAVNVRPGRRMEVRFNERSDVMFVSMRPAVLTVIQLSGLSAKADEELRRLVAEELRRARLDPVALEEKSALEGSSGHVAISRSPPRPLARRFSSMGRPSGRRRSCDLASLDLTRSSWRSKGSCCRAEPWSFRSTRSRSSPSRSSATRVSIPSRRRAERRQQRLT